MTAEELTQAQENLHKEIQVFAEKNCSANEELCPIYDGIANIDAYLKSPLKIMWILKEPYDEDGGGWQISEAYKNDDKNRATYRRMAYSAYGFNHKMYYDEICKIIDKESKVSVLDSIAYINLSKMPGNKKTSDAAAKAYYTLWKDILHKQIKTYDPDVIIFGGTGTMKCFEFDNEPQLFETFFNSDVKKTCNAELYQHKDKWLISIEHPAGPGVNDDVYIDSLIDALKTILEHRKS